MVLLVTTAASNDACFGLFLVLALGWGLLYMVAGVWANQAQRQFFRLYRDRYRPDLPLPQEANRRVFEEPGRGIPDMIGSYPEWWSIARTRQTDPELEQARQRTLRRWGLLIAIMVLSPIWVIGLSKLAGC